MFENNLDNLLSFKWFLLMHVQVLFLQSGSWCSGIYICCLVSIDLCHLVLTFIMVI